MTKIVKASLNINIFVDCPNCDAMLDLLNSDDTSGHDHNEECYLIDQAIPDKRNWGDAHRDFEAEDIKCCECGHEFNAKGLDW